ncbi:MAG: AtpZ/AtpI family protein [Pseudomonadota bacterium]|nr:AtpZ/AtpI family protein [Pseudomonadota bacterium]
MAEDFDNVSEKEIRNTLIHKANLHRLRQRQGRGANFGMIASLGGVIIVPILIGIFVGGWLDENWPQNFSWRLNLLFLGFVWGLVNGYFWLKVEEAKIVREEQREKNLTEGDNT